MQIRCQIYIPGIFIDQNSSHIVNILLFFRRIWEKLILFL
jgi:hypothetical protein